MNHDHTVSDRAARPVARARDASPADQVRALLDALHSGVTTRETIPTYRRVKRGQNREVAVLDFKPHRTDEPGLLVQLGITTRRPGTVPVEIRRWERNPDDPCRRDYGDDRDNRECRHGRWVTVRTEQRTVPGVVTAGGALPGGSPGWDADGALSPMTASGKPEAAEPIADAWHTAAEIREGLHQLGLDLHARGWRQPDTLIDIALKDEQTGEWIARRLRSLVDRARIAASYDAPIVPLRDVYCPECGGELRVRADASSAVWCAGSWIVEGPAMPGEPWPVTVWCGARWPQGAWVELLEDAAPPEPVQAPNGDLRAARATVGQTLTVAEAPAVLIGLID